MNILFTWLTKHFTSDRIIGAQFTTTRNEFSEEFPENSGIKFFGTHQSINPQSNNVKSM